MTGFVISEKDITFSTNHNLLHLNWTLHKGFQFDPKIRNNVLVEDAYGFSIHEQELVWGYYVQSETE